MQSAMASIPTWLCVRFFGLSVFLLWVFLDWDSTALIKTKPFRHLAMAFVIKMYSLKSKQTTQNACYLLFSSFLISVVILFIRSSIVASLFGSLEYCPRYRFVYHFQWRRLGLLLWVFLFFLYFIRKFILYRFGAVMIKCVILILPWQKLSTMLEHCGYNVRLPVHCILHGN